jgi:hypothetical protein
VRDGGTFPRWLSVTLGIACLVGAVAVGQSQLFVFMFLLVAGVGLIVPTRASKP